MTTLKTLAALGVISIAIGAWYFFSYAVNLVSQLNIPYLHAEAAIPHEPKQTPLEHRRETWLSALEWCESRGVTDAVNPKDRDGTPSYYSFQFKPSTFKLFAIKYGFLPANLEDADYDNWLGDYATQRNIVRRMIDDPSVDWYQQFPDCVTKHVGLPPIK